MNGSVFERAVDALLKKEGLTLMTSYQNKAGRFKFKQKKDMFFSLYFFRLKLFAQLFLRSSAKMASMLWVKVEGGESNIRVLRRDLPVADVAALLKNVKETS